MTNEEAKVFLDNLKICINEHPVVADWLVEIADRKTENSSEKPNNCKAQTKDLFTDKDGDVWEWRGDAWYCISGGEPQTDNGIGCSRCEGRFWCMDRDMPHAVHCNNYGKITDEQRTERRQK